MRNKKIPKIIHRIWLGNREMPLPFKKWESHLKILHANWTFLTWTDSNIYNLEGFDKKIFEKLKNFSEKSDYIRFLCIYNFGGIYMDTDIEATKDFSVLLENEFFIGSEVGLKGDKMLNGAFYGAIKNHFLLKNLIHLIEARINNGDPNLSSAWKIGPHFITPFLLDNKKWIKIYDSDFFHPIPWWYRGNNPKQFITKRTITIHHFYCSWKPKWIKIFDIIKIGITLFLGKIKDYT